MIGDWGAGATPSRSHPEYYQGDIPWLKTGDLTDGYITSIPESISALALEKTSVKLNPAGSILMAMYGATIGKLGILAYPATTNQACCACFPYNGILNLFLFYYLMGQRESFIKKGEGGAQPNISKEKIVASFIAIPPAQEQLRIVASIASLLPLVDNYKKTEQELASLNKKLPDFLKKSILQYAIQGKLVPQDPTDEPASVLLERIAKERAKKGKKAAKSMSRIERRDRGTYEIFPDGSEKDISEEIPFDIPDSWVWCRLDMLGDYKKGPFGSSLTKSCFVPKASNSVKVYEQKNAIQKNHILGSYYISAEYFEKAMRSFEVHGGDIIVSCAGTIGETYKLPEEAKSGIINQALMRVRLTPLLCDSFFLMYFDYIVKVQAKESSKGSAIKNIPPFAIFKKLLMPVPPQAEQHRIVEKLGVLMEEIGVTK